MSKSFCPADCGKKFVNAEAAHKHADEFHHGWRTPKRKGWRTPHGFGDWKEPITYEEACEQMAILTQGMRERLEAHKYSEQKNNPTTLSFKE